MSIYPTVRPSLTLDFRKSKQLDPRILFSRSSSATYVEGGVIKYADEHQARFEDKGLLMEESRTNICPYSETFQDNGDDTGWRTSGGTVTPSAGTSPSNGAASSIDGSIYKRLNWGAPGTQNATSVYVKAGTGTTGTISHANSNAGGISFDLVAGTVSELFTCDGTFIEAVGNGWFRIGFNRTSTSTLTAVNLYLTTTPGKTVLFWGVQVEKPGTFSTSYIPTAGATATRAADIASITGANFSSWYNQIQGSFFVGANHKGSSHFNNAIFLKVNNGTTNNQIKIFSVGADPYLYITDTAAVQAYIDAGSVSVGLPNKYAAGFTTNNFALSVNGATAVTDASGTNPTGMTQLAIGARLSGVGQPNGHISRISYYPERLTDEQLEAITS